MTDMSDSESPTTIHENREDSFIINNICKLLVLADESILVGTYLCQNVG